MALGIPSVRAGDAPGLEPAKASCVPPEPTSRDECPVHAARCARVVLARTSRRGEAARPKVRDTRRRARGVSDVRREVTRTSRVEPRRALRRGGTSKPSAQTGEIGQPSIFSGSEAVTNFRSRRRLHRRARGSPSENSPTARLQKIRHVKKRFRRHPASPASPTRRVHGVAGGGAPAPTERALSASRAKRRSLLVEHDLPELEPVHQPVRGGHGDGPARHQPQRSLLCSPARPAGTRSSTLRALQLACATRSSAAGASQSAATISETICPSRSSRVMLGPSTHAIARRRLPTSAWPHSTSSVTPEMSGSSGSHSCHFRVSSPETRASASDAPVAPPSVNSRSTSVVHGGVDELGERLHLRHLVVAGRVREASPRRPSWARR